jgi:hypothetical protein
MAECAYWRSTSLGNVLAQSPGEASGNCTTLVVLTPAEYAAFSSNPFNLSYSDGALVSSAIVAVWGAAWVFKALILTLNSDGEARND